VAEELPTLGDYHRLNYSWHPSADRLVYFKDRRLWLVDVGPDGPARARPLGESLGDLAPTLHWFTRDGSAVVVGTDPQDDRGYGDIRPRGIALVPLDGGTPLRVPIDDARWVYRGILKADERTVWQPDGASIALLLEERATGEKAVVRLNPGDGTSTVQWKGLARLANLTSGGGHDFIVGTFEDLRTPPDVYRFPADFGSRERISRIEPRLDRIAATSAELFETTVPLHDGRLGKVRTAVLLPAGAKRGDRLPGLVLMYPGGDVSREAEQYGGGASLSVPTLLFTSRGYAVILANLTLGPNREAGNPMQEMVDVLLPQVYRAAELGYVDLERLALSGQSFGGFGTAAIISRTNLFRAAVAVSGIFDLPGTYGHMDQGGGSFWIGWSEGGQARMGTHPWANLRRYLDNSPYYQADKIFTPLLIVHGDADMAYHDGQKLFTALRRLERPAQLASYAGQGHVIYEWKRASAIDAARRIVEFYRRHLGDPAGPAPRAP
jgi:acetyl esterase/lipase